MQLGDREGRASVDRHQRASVSDEAVEVSNALGSDATGITGRDRPLLEAVQDPFGTHVGDHDDVEAVVQVPSSDVCVIEAREPEVETLE